jgi:hypothetical protein
MPIIIISKNKDVIVRRYSRRTRGMDGNTMGPCGQFLNFYHAILLSKISLLYSRNVRTFSLRIYAGNSNSDADVHGDCRARFHYFLGLLRKHAQQSLHRRNHLPNSHFPLSYIRCNHETGQFHGRKVHQYSQTQESSSNPWLFDTHSL